MSTEGSFVDMEYVRLVVGLKKYPPDSDNAESGVQEIMLDHADLGGTGFRLSDFDDAWRPGRPGLKSGGVFTDESDADGRVLRNARYDNVRADLRVTVTGSYTEMGARIAKLQRFVSYAHANAISRAQNDPVYVEWKALGASIPQYALIYDIEMAVSRPDAGAPMQNVQLTIVREPFWRGGVPPGWNPIVYRQLIDDGIVSQTLSDYLLNPLVTVKYAAASGTVKNRMEKTPGQENAPLTVNYIDIAAEDLPGDAPALCTIVADIHADVFRPKTIYIARDTKPDLTFPQPTGSGEFFDFPTIAGGDAGWMTAWQTTPAKVTGTGLLSDGSAVTRSVLDITVGTGALTDGEIVEWGNDESGILDEPGNSRFHTMGLRGKYVVFMRNNVQSGSGDDIELYLRFIFDPPTDGSTQTSGIGNVVDLPVTVNPVTVVTQRDSTNLAYALSYMGTIDIPAAIAAGGGLDGLGLDNISRVRIQLRHRARGTASAMEFRILDLILMKYDEAFAMIEYQANPTDTISSVFSTHHQAIYDNTGYFTHGKPEAVAVGARAGGVGVALTYFELRGQEIFLMPGIRNRLYFMNDEYVRLSASTSEVISDWQTGATDDLNRDMIVRVYIVPRWIGAIDI